MSDIVRLHFDIDGEDLNAAGQASASVKKTLRQIGLAPEVIKKASIAMYEGEINMVIHAGGGQADVAISPQCIQILLTDYGNGIPDVDLAMKEGYSTASDEARRFGFGAGMGLPNMKKYTDGLKIETRVGEGTTIELTVDIA